MVTLSQFLLEEMRREHLSQSELARKIGVYPDYIRRWIDGDQPGSKSCAQIADGLGVPVNLVLQMAGYPVDAEPVDTQWELEQRKIKGIYEGIDRDKWDALTEALRALKSLTHSSPTEPPDPAPQKTTAGGAGMSRGAGRPQRLLNPMGASDRQILAGVA